MKLWLGLVVMELHTKPYVMTQAGTRMVVVRWTHLLNCEADSAEIAALAHTSSLEEGQTRGRQALRSNRVSYESSYEYDILECFVRLYSNAVFVVVFSCHRTRRNDDTAGRVCMVQSARATQTLRPVFEQASLRSFRERCGGRL